MQLARPDGDHQSCQGGEWQTIEDCGTRGCSLDLTGGCLGDLGASCIDDGSCGAGTCQETTDGSTVCCDASCGECLVCSPEGSACTDPPDVKSGCDCTEADASNCDDGVSCTDDKCQDGACSNDLQAGYCLIDGQCLDHNQPEAGNPCRYCDSAVRDRAWTNSSNAVTCEDSLWCNGVDTCDGSGQCQHQYPSSGDSVACNGATLPSSWADSIGCSANQTCNASSSACQAKLGCGNTWCDSSTGLCWTLNEPDNMPLAEANAYCADLGIAGRTWRLPSLPEWLRLAKGCEEATGEAHPASFQSTCEWDPSASPTIGWCVGCEDGEGPSNGCYWPSGMGSCDPVGYWSSTESAGTFFLYMQVNRAQTLSDSAPQAIRCVTEQDP